MTEMSTPTRPARSVAELQADLEASRARLASTIDELTARANPKTIVRNQADAVKVRFTEAATTPEGDIRVERVGALAAAVVAVLVVIVLIKRR